METAQFDATSIASRLDAATQIASGFLETFGGRAHAVAQAMYEQAIWTFDDDWIEFWSKILGLLPQRQIADVSALSRTQTLPRRRFRGQSAVEDQRRAGRRPGHHFQWH
jgi:hypothetical protein